MLDKTDDWKVTFIFDLAEKIKKIISFKIECSDQSSFSLFAIYKLV